MEITGFVFRHPSSPKPRVLAAAFILCYMLLDWTSFIAPIKYLNVTAWNPAPALGLLLILNLGSRALPAVFTAIFLSDVLVRSTPGNLTTTLLTDALLTGGYSIMAYALKRHFPENGLFSDRPGLLVWSLIVMLGSLLNGLVYVTSLWFVADLLIPNEWAGALLRFWIGDAVGIYIFLPVFWWLADHNRRRLFIALFHRLETIAYMGFIIVAIIVAFGYGAQANFRYFYVLFLPVIWAASRQGLPGAVLCTAALQLWMLMAGSVVATEGLTLLEVQIRAFLIALVAFLIGVTVDEHRRAMGELKESLRLAAAGEMAAALAHELNQPLAALSAYGSACELIMKNQPEDLQLRQVIQHMIDEARRAASIVARLRDFFRSGATHMEQIVLRDLIETATRPFLKKAHSANIDFSVPDIPGNPILMGDRLQLEVVLRNLLANAFDAVASKHGAIRLTIEHNIDNRIDILVEDDGNGLTTDISEKIFEPFVTNKSSGLGLGLAISRAIAEAHGGKLVAECQGHGCFRLSLPTESRGGTAHG